MIVGREGRSDRKRLHSGRKHARLSNLQEPLVERRDMLQPIFWILA